HSGDIRDVLYPNHEDSAEATRTLSQTRSAQPALFAIEYALASVLMSWDIRPHALIGHSIGEYVAACLAGVFSVEDALSIVAARGALIQQLPAGSMLSVPLSERELQPFLNEKISIAAINAPSLCVVSGESEAIKALEHTLHREKLICHYLQTSHAFHSAMMDSALQQLAECAERIDLESPRSPFISNTTGTWATPQDAVDPAYWARHLRCTVRFSDGIGELLKQNNRVFLEVGPGATLSTLTKKHLNGASDHLVLPCMRQPLDRQSDLEFLLKTLGALWLGGVDINWTGFSAAERRHRVPLPTYSFQRQRYWMSTSPDRTGARTSVLDSGIDQHEPINGQDIEQL